MSESGHGDGSALRFRLDARTSASHRLRVTLEIDRSRLLSPKGDVELFLPVWTPGSYLIREYQRHVEALRAADAESGTELAWTKSAKNRFRIRCEGAGPRVAVRYEVYGHELTVRTADFTADHAFWNGACVCLWPVGGEALPAVLELAVPAGWRWATQLPVLSTSPPRLEAADLHAVVDAPFLLSAEWTELRFEMQGKPHRLLLDGLAAVEPPASLAEDTRRIVEQAAAVFGGELPYERYDFLVLLSDAGRGGLEHESCSVLLAPRTTFATPRDYEDFMGLVAHELFHVWNVKRMRPESLWRYDYERENHTTLLWVAEGVTSYYDDLLCVRAGVLGRDRYLEILGESVTAMHRAPGRRVQSLSAASFDAWIKLYRPDENSRNSTQSYYSNGALAALCLDLSIRARTGGRRCLDDAMAALWRETFLRGRGYRRRDVVAALNAAAGEDLGPLVRELVDGPFEPPLEALLEPFGLRPVRESGEGPELGLQFRRDALVVSSVVRGSPAADAGVSPGDELLAVNGLRLQRDTWRAVVRAAWKPEHPLSLLMARRGRIAETTIPAGTPAAATWRIEVASDPTPEQAALRRGWLGS